MGIFGREEVISRLGAPLDTRLDIVTTDITGSTNNDIKAAAAKGAPEGLVIIAGEQTAGKGRLGRSFWSPRDTGLYFSILLRPRVSAADALSITTAAAVAVSEAIDELTGLHAGIKWVNDIYISGRKVCGILTEASLMPDGGMDLAVLGIGVNVAENDFPDDIRDKAGSIGAASDIRPALAAGILTRFFAYYDDLPSKGYMDEYRARSILSGKTVEYEQGGVMRTAEVIGTDDSARLIVRDADGKTSYLSSGEVNIKSFPLK